MRGPVVHSVRTAWLFGAHTASLSEDSLIVFSKDGTEIGTLTRQD